MTAAPAPSPRSLADVLGAEPGEASGLFAPWRDLRRGDPEIGRELAAGRFAFAGALVTADDPATLWTQPTPAPRWRAWAHSFSWLIHVCAAGAEDAARAFVDAWLSVHAKSGPADEAPEVAARRIVHWLGAGAVLFTGAEGAERRAALVRQARRLERNADKASPAQSRVAVASAAAAVCAEDDAKRRRAALTKLDAVLDRQFFPDGGHVSRSPATLSAIAADLCALDDAVAQVDPEARAPLRRMAARLAAMVRFFQMPDGGLATYHGGDEGDRAMIEAVLAYAAADGRAFGVAPHSGFQRVVSDHGVLIMDVGAPAVGPDGVDAHASPLAFEFAARSGRLVVSCAWAPEQPEAFREPVRATAAHSGVVLADTSAARLARNDALAKAPKAPITVDARRLEEDLGVWVDGSHEGYMEEFGFVHRRRVFTAGRGGDIRGEDMVSRPVGASAGRPRVPYTLRFHLHPDARVAPSRDGKAALITLGSGESWRFRTDVGPLSVEPSVYLGAGVTPRETVQITIGATAEADMPIDRPPNRVRWALQRLGRAPAA